MGDARPVKDIIKEKEVRMKEAAHDLEFELAAILRDEIRELKARVQISEKNVKSKGRKKV
jgi:excinuclease UvrABC helicase subunit UvrB